jgi:hypothetical protein
MRSLVAGLLIASSLRAQGSLQRVASTAGDDNMGAPAALAVSRTGEIYVADAQRLNIAVYDSAGRRVRTIGRNGEGPGELLSVGDMAWLGDTLVFYDWRLRRLTYFSQDGKVVRTAAWPSRELPDHLLGSGGPTIHAVAYGRGHDIPIVGTEGTRRVRPAKSFLHLNSNGSASKLALPTLPPDPDGHDCWNDPKASIYWTDNEPGGRGPFNAFTSTGAFVYATADRTQVGWRRGTTETTVTYSSVPVTDAIWKREAAEHVALEAKVGKLTCSPAMVRPASLPPVRGIVADDRGGVWVEVTTPTGSRFDVYDAAGKLVASVPAPTRRLETVPFVVRGDRLYLPIKDEDDVISISVYRLHR